MINKHILKLYMLLQIMQQQKQIQDKMVMWQTDEEVLESLAKKYYSACCHVQPVWKAVHTHTFQVFVPVCISNSALDNCLLYKATACSNNIIILVTFKTGINNSTGHKTKT
jgi:hypothetical protein